MTLQTPPSWLQAGSYPAQYDRIIQQALYASTGIIGSSSLAVTANSPAGMSVRVASGWAAIIGTTQSDMGCYTFYNDATVTQTITTADPTNPRIDLVVATVRDAYYSGAYNDVIFQVIAGTPAGSPVAPSLPDNSISLAEVYVGAAVTQINTGDINDTRAIVTTNLPVTDSLIVSTSSSTNYTFAISDNNKLIEFTSNSPIAITVPTNASVPFPIGATINFEQKGTGQITIAGAGGVTVNSSYGLLSRTQYSLMSIIKVDTNSWLLAGDTTI